MITYLYTDRDKFLQDGKNFKFAISGKGGKTYAVEQLPKSAIETLRIGSSISFKVGMATCSPKDNFSKKIGRELAEKNMQYLEFKVTKITLTEGRADVQLNSDKFQVELFIKEDKEFTRIDYVHQE